MLSTKLTLSDLTAEQLAGKKVLMRVDFNVPFGKDGKISNNQRISETIPTINEIFSKGANSLVLLSHLGRPNGRVEAKSSLKPVAERLSELVGKPVTFLKDCIGAEVLAATANPKKGEIILLENARFHIEEEGSGVDANGKSIKADKVAVEAFRAELSKLGDVYINDAFGTAHRAHSSMVGVNLPIRVAGNLMSKELKAFIPVLEIPQKPVLSILGGSKVTDKIKLIKNLLDKVDEMIICGGMAFTFLKVAYGVEIGKSLYDAEGANIVNELLAKAKEKNVNIILPVDHVAGDAFKADCKTVIATNQEGVPAGYSGFDAGPESTKLFQAAVSRANTIIWNGPAGVYEFEPFQKSTRGILDAAAAAKERGAIVVIGGGDCATCALQWGYADRITHVSTGGGASLQLLEGGDMPGISALSSK